MQAATEREYFPLNVCDDLRHVAEAVAHDVREFLAREGSPDNARCHENQCGTSVWERNGRSVVRTPTALCRALSYHVRVHIVSADGVQPGTEKTEIAVFGGGCFWCTEAVFGALRGVVSVMPGYAGGHVQNPTYEQVSSGTTGHAEGTKVVFHPRQIQYRDLLTVFFSSHDPTTVNRQGNDVGPQYRSIILYTSENQKREAEKFIQELNASDPHGKPIVTELKPLEAFFEAEGYHQNYFRKNPSQAYCQLVIHPKLEKLRERYAELLKTSRDA